MGTTAKVGNSTTAETVRGIMRMRKGGFFEMMQVQRQRYGLQHIGRSQLEASMHVRSVRRL